MRAVLVTVVGPTGQRDLSLPADVPTTELLPALAGLLSGRPPPPPRPADPRGRPPPVWALLTAAGQPVPPGATLAEHSILHGEHLYLVAEPLRHLRP